MLLRLLLLSGLVAFAYAQCGCSPSMTSDENGLPKPDPETGLFEGDMRLTSNNFLEMLGLRNAVSNLWPGRVLHYWVSSGYESNIVSALNALSAATGNCIRFEKRTNQAAFVEVINQQGCWSMVGRTGSRQQLSLQANGCYAPHIIQHEFIHALGLYHEQSRPDRDNYLSILWGNIDSRQCHNFYRQGSLPGGFPGYDYRSIMHYESTAFTCNGRNTMTNKQGGNVGGNSLTQTDVQKLRTLYRC